METLEEHQKEVDKLSRLENELVGLIANTNDAQLMEKFSEWQEQRIKCNEGFNEFIGPIECNVNDPSNRKTP